jgi:4-hydroxy-3-methylbut-2-en-1-yl diphosphate reductase
MKSFQIPEFYKSNIIGRIKNYRRNLDKLKRDFTPTVLDFGEVQFLIARHFGFCYGVENAVEIAYKTIENNPDKRIFLLGEMIHNPEVNADLQSRGLRFLVDTHGHPLMDWNELRSDDVVIIPAFGITLETIEKLNKLGIQTEQYDTTCPFVEKVWNRAAQIGQKDYTVVVHGKPTHEETRATFSHARQHAPTVVVNDMAEAQRLAVYIRGQAPATDFYTEFKGRFSEGFDPQQHLQRLGVVNQTTMLAADTQAIADYLKQVMVGHFGVMGSDASAHFADTRDTLCYATNDNQTATFGLLEVPADLAVVVGGYNSSNTSHIVELCEQKLPTFYIDSFRRISDQGAIQHFDLHQKKEIQTTDFLPSQRPLRIILTAGASCPDSVLEAVLLRVLSFFENARSVEEVMETFA